MKTAHVDFFYYSMSDMDRTVWDRAQDGWVWLGLKG